MGGMTGSLDSNRDGSISESSQLADSCLGISVGQALKMALKMERCGRWIQRGMGHNLCLLLSKV